MGKKERTMANMEHLTHLRQGAVHWNTWRAEQPVDLRPDLSGALLGRDDDLNEINLNDANLSDAELSCTTLIGANLSRANLRKAGLNEAFLPMANLSDADLYEAHLTRADLSDAHLTRANLSGALLDNANLREADLSGADLSGANLSGADLSGAVVFGTIFSDLDLRGVRGLDTLVHTGPSTIGTDTLVRSQGDLPKAFLRGAGLPDTFIAYARSFVQRPIKCFISYASKDQAFATRLHADLQQRGVRCWFASPEDKIWQHIAESMRPCDKLILVLSEHSIASVWVEFEVKYALATEHSSDALVLFPVRLDDTIQHSTANWATHLQQMRQITDFTRWKQHDHYQKALSRLLRDLQQSSEQQRQAAPSP
jgi:uncharacterized protein YjbI with pentapeptide repeats